MCAQVRCKQTRWRRKVPSRWVSPDPLARLNVGAETTRFTPFATGGPLERRPRRTQRATRWATSSGHRPVVHCCASRRPLGRKRARPPSSSRSALLRAAERRDSLFHEHTRTNRGRNMSPNTTSYEGRCTCSHVQFRLTSQPMIVHCCHCRWCQRETGSSYAVNALIESDRVEVQSGEVEMIQTPTNSGSGQRISRCPTCKVALWSHYAYPGIGSAMSFVRVGTLSAADSLRPSIHIFTVSKQPWITLDSSIPSVPKFYKASEYWSLSSLERRALLFEAA